MQGQNSGPESAVSMSADTFVSTLWYSYVKATGNAKPTVFH